MVRLMETQNDLKFSLAKMVISPLQIVTVAQQKSTNILPAFSVYTTHKLLSAGGMSLIRRR